MLGIDFQEAMRRDFADCYSISCIRMTEIFEWCLATGLQFDSNKSTANAGVAAGFSKSLSGLFGFSSESTPSVAVGDSKEVSFAKISTEQLYSIKSVLCPVKLRLAFLLCDFGLIQEALSYAQSVKDAVSSIESQGKFLACIHLVRQILICFIVKNVKNAAANGEPTGLKPFSKKFVQDLDDFVTRLQISLGKDS